jgi:mRNA interferase MazF
MQKSTSKYDQGDILILELPFTDLVGSKLRPVLVISRKDLGNDIIVLKITGTPGRFRVKLTQKDLEEGNLKKESYIDCSSIFTVDKKLVVKKVGRIKKEKLRKVLSILREVLGV